MSTFQEKRQELAKKTAEVIIRAEKEKDVRDILLEHANLTSSSGKTNLEDVLDSFTELATKADSEQVRSQTSIQYLKFLGKADDSDKGSGSKPLNLQININPVKAETTID